MFRILLELLLLNTELNYLYSFTVHIHMSIKFLPTYALLL